MTQPTSHIELTKSFPSSGLAFRQLPSAVARAHRWPMAPGPSPLIVCDPWPSGPRPEPKSRGRLLRCWSVLADQKRGAHRARPLQYRNRGLRRARAAAVHIYPHNHCASSRSCMCMHAHAGVVMPIMLSCMLLEPQTLGFPLTGMMRPYAHRAPALAGAYGDRGRPTHQGSGFDAHASGAQWRAEPPSWTRARANTRNL